MAEREGSIYFDDIMFIYGSNPNDTNLPEVTTFTVNDEPMTDGMVLTENELNFYWQGISGWKYHPGSWHRL